MTKKIQFHAGKNHKKSKGGLNPQTQKEKKKLAFTGIELMTFRSEEQNTTTELRRHIT